MSKKINLLNINSANLYEKVSYQLLINGFSVIDDFLNVKEDLFVSLENLHYSKDIDSEDNSYKGGYCKIYEDINTIKKDGIPTSINQLVRNKIINKIASQFLNTDEFKIDVFQTLDTINSDHIAQKPHFDRIPTLKFMLYINDIDENNGAFCLSPGSHHWVRQNFPLPRPKHSDKDYFEKSRNLPSPSIENLIQIKGKAGQLLIFHTDCIHHQGIVKKGDTRIIRAHFRNIKEYSNRGQSKFLYMKSLLKSGILSFKNNLKIFKKNSN